MLPFLLPLLTHMASNPGAPGSGGAGLSGLMQKYPGAAGLLTSLAGGLIAGKSGNHALDPEYLKQKFGAQALGPEYQQTLNTLMNSPHVREAMTQAAQAGSQFTNDLNAKTSAAQGDSSSGVGSFTQAAANAAPGAFQREVQSQTSKQAMDIAQQNLQNRMGAYTQSYGIQQQQPSFGQILGGNIANAGSQLALQPKTSGPNAASPTAAATNAGPAATEGAPAPSKALVAPQPLALQPSRMAVGPASAVFSGRRRGPAAALGF